MKRLSYFGTFFFANGSVIMGRMKYYLFEILAPHAPKVWIRPCTVVHHKRRALKVQTA
jgi:hypothetical protein